MLVHSSPNLGHAEAKQRENNVSSKEKHKSSLKSFLMQSRRPKIALQRSLGILNRQQNEYDNYFASIYAASGPTKIRKSVKGENNQGQRGEGVGSGDSQSLFITIKPKCQTVECNLFSYLSVMQTMIMYQPHFVAAEW